MQIDDYLSGISWLDSYCVVACEGCDIVVNGANEPLFECVICSVLLQSLIPPLVVKIKIESANTYFAAGKVHLLIQREVHLGAGSVCVWVWHQCPTRVLKRVLVPRPAPAIVANISIGHARTILFVKSGIWRPIEQRLSVEARREVAETILVSLIEILVKT